LITIDGTWVVHLVSITQDIISKLLSGTIDSLEVKKIKWQPS
jgi:hypothetical protein